MHKIITDYEKSEELLSTSQSKLEQSFFSFYLVGFKRKFFITNWNKPLPYNDTLYNSFYFLHQFLMIINAQAWKTRNSHLISLDPIKYLSMLDFNVNKKKSHNTMVIIKDENDTDCINRNIKKINETFFFNFYRLKYGLKSNRSSTFHKLR